MIACSFCVMLSSFRSIFSSLRSMDSSFWISLLSERWISERRSLASRSASLLSLCASSFASRIASFFIFSDLLSASRIRFLAFCSALPIAFSPTFLRYISDQRADCKRNHRNYNFHYNWAHCSTSFLFNFCFFLFFFSIIVYNIYCMKIYESKCIT